MTNTLILAPSLLGGKQDALQESLKLAEETGVPWIHLDVMDGHFVPNIKLGANIISDLRKYSKLFFDVHLMLSHPDKYLDSFVDAGADSITIHLEPDYPIKDTLIRIREHGLKAGIALNPKTSIKAVLPYIELVDLVVIMTVNPGFGGQSFIPHCLKKIKQLKNIKDIKKYNFRIEVDGGVNLENASQCIELGADTLVCGTSFYQASDPLQFYQDILNAAN